MFRYLVPSMKSLPMPLTASDSFSSLLKKAHLQRWLARALVAAYLEYASLGPIARRLAPGPF